jgi:eukaryotic-like serine/threonine-protein kinase
MAMGQPNPPRGEGFSDPRFAAGTQLGKYELIAPIGSGGMASVILARTRGPGGFEKVVVIKVIHPHMASDEVAVSMLLDEGRLAALIEHPNVVHTYEVGEAFGTFYIVMEYLAGESLHTVIRQSIQPSSGPFHPTLAGKIISDACEGLHAAHELTDFNGVNRQIVHRDISPGNIVVLYNGQVKVVDFGIAKAQGRATETQVGELKGKYGYMSPEQINNEKMDRRSDVFSLGVTMWEALAKRRLFHQENIGATLMQILRGPRVPPSTYDREVPKALDEIAQKALQPDPRDRWQSAGEMKRAIDDAIWQSRVGTGEVQKYMHSLFAQRMEARRQLLAAATDSSLDEVIDLLTRERSAVHAEELLSQHIGRASQPLSNRTPAPVRYSSSPAMPYPDHGPGSERVSYPAQGPGSGRGSYPQMAPGSQRISHPPGSLVIGPNGQQMYQPEAPSNPGWMPPGMQHAYPGQMPLTGSRVIEERSRWRFYAIVATTLLIGIVGTILAFTALSSNRSGEPAVEKPKTKPKAPILSPEDIANIQPTPPPTTVKDTGPTVPVKPTTNPTGTPDGSGTTPAPSVIPDAGIDAGTGAAPPVDEPPPTSVTTDSSAGTKPKNPGSSKRDPGDNGASSKREPVDVVTVEDGGSEEPPGGDEKELKEKAAAYFAAGNLDKAEEYYKKAVATNPRYAPAHRGLGLVYQRRKMVKAAIKSYNRYLELQPKAHDAKDIKERLRQLGDE